MKEEQSPVQLKNRSRRNFLRLLSGSVVVAASSLACAPDIRNLPGARSTGSDSQSEENPGTGLLIAQTEDNIGTAYSMILTIPLGAIAGGLIGGKLAHMESASTPSMQGEATGVGIVLGTAVGAIGGGILSHPIYLLRKTLLG